MEEFEMTQTELILFLETLAENVELKAKTGEDAAGIIRKKIEVLKKETPTPGQLWCKFGSEHIIPVWYYSGNLCT